MNAREDLAEWMLKNGFATGHGDTIEDLLKELAVQIGEEREKCRTLEDEAAATLRYINSYSDEMAKIGRGSEQFGKEAPSFTLAGRLASAIRAFNADFAP